MGCQFMYVSPVCVFKATVHYEVLEWRDMADPVTQIALNSSRARVARCQ